MNRKKATKRIGKMQRCVSLMTSLNGSYLEAQEIGRLGLDGRAVVLKHMFTLDDVV